MAPVTPLKVDSLLTINYTLPSSPDHICKPNPCHNGGSCIEEGSSYRCVCQVGNHGERCEREYVDSFPSSFFVNDRSV